MPRGNTPSLLFALPPYEVMGRALKRTANLTSGKCTFSRFPNGELTLRVAPPVQGRDCIILASVSPPDDRLLSLLLLADTLHKEGAGSITAIVPYLGYARQEKPEPGKSRATMWLFKLLAASSIDQLITIDVHYQDLNMSLKLPLTSLPTTELWRDALEGRLNDDTTLVAPDEGARERCMLLQQAAGIRREVAYFKKRRSQRGITHSSLQGRVSKRAMVLDDILDTGATLLSCCRELNKSGVEDITVLVSHGLFTGTAWQGLWQTGVTKIFTTDTWPRPPHAGTSKIITLPTLPLLRRLVGN